MTDTVTETVAEVEPPVVAQTEQLVVDPPAPEPTQEPQPEPVVTEHGNKGKSPWYVKRINDETNAKNEEREARLAAERRAQEAEARAALAQRGVQTDTAPVQPTQTPTPEEIRQLVKQEAANQRFQEETIAVRNAGLQKFGSQFENDLNILNAIGVTNNDVVADLLAVDKVNTHDLLHKLAADPEKAAVIAKMDTRTRIAELTRMTMAQAEPAPVAAAPKPAPKQVSRAPAPPPPVDPSTSKTVDWRSDEVSDAEFSRGWNENMAKRANRR